MSEITSPAVAAALGSAAPPLLAVGRAQGGAVPRSLSELDRAAGGVVGRAITSGDFKGKRDEMVLLYPSGAKPQRLLLVGLGKPGEVTRNSLRRAAAVAGKRARALGGQQFAFAVAAEARNGVPPADLGQVAVEGVGQGAWVFTELKAAPEEPKPEGEAVTLVCDAKELPAVTAGPRAGACRAARQPPAASPPRQPGHGGTATELAAPARRAA